MGQTENVEKAPKTSWFDGVKAEFKKIIWPEQKSVVRQTIAVRGELVCSSYLFRL